jgi:hypothetical protein
LPFREKDHAHLLITAKADFSLDGCSIEQAERKLWGLARIDAGSTALTQSTITAGAPATFTVTYTAAQRGLPPGAEVQFTLPRSFSFPQTSDPEQPGYTCITSRRNDISIVDIDRSIESHEKTDIICRLSTGLRPRETFGLSYRTERTYIFPCRFHETDRRYWYMKMPPLSAAAAISDSSPFVFLDESNSQSFEVFPGAVERLHLFLPGRRCSSESLTLGCTFTDLYRNVPPKGTMVDVALTLLHNGKETPLGTAGCPGTNTYRFKVPLPRLKPGIYRAVARSIETNDVMATSNPMEIIDPEDGTDRIFWGEIHAHTEMSDGSGDFKELYRHAREDGCLDFAAAADHACYFSDNEWQAMQDITNSWNSPGEFVTLIGYEWAGRQVHRNIYTSRDRLDLFRGMYPPTGSIDTVWKHFHGDEEIAAGPHAPIAHGLVWEHHDPAVERFIEVYSMWGASDFMDNPLVPEWAKSNDHAMTVNQVLATGAKLGFTGGGDCHEGHAGFSSEDPEGQGTTPHTFAELLLYRCGMTAAVIPSLDRPSLIKALRNRRTYATTGARILVDFSAAGFSMGAEGNASEVECRVRVHGVDRIREIRIIRDGKIAWSEVFDDLDVASEWKDPEPPTMQHYYYLHVIQTDGQMAWSSPIWISPQKERFAR